MGLGGVSQAAKLSLLGSCDCRFRRYARPILKGEKGAKQPLPLCVTIRALSRRLTMASTVVWVVGIVLEAVPLVRAAESKFLQQYKLFYSYLGFVVLRDLWLLAVYFIWPRFYTYAYWCSEPISALVGCGLVWEVYKIALARYPGTARMARNVLTFLFILASTRILVKAWNSPTWIPGRTVFEIERDLRIVQGALLAGLIVLFACYSIPLGRNLNGITYGYGLFLITSVVNLTLRDQLGNGFQRSWEYIQPISYILVVLVWCSALWSYAPIPEPPTEPGLEGDYEFLVAATKRKVHSARSYILKAMRP